MSVRDSLLPHGYIHRHDLIDRGWRPDALRAAVRAEGLVTLRRQWIVHPSTPVPLRLAAASGGRVTCVTAAVTLGLWDPKTAGDPHIVLPPHSGSGCVGARVHRSLSIVAPPPRRLIDPIENVLARVATCLPLEDALAVWESAVKQGLTTTHHLGAIAWRGSRARELAASTGRLSDSGLESLFTHRLRVAGIVMRQQVWIAGHNVDGLIGARLVVQIDGFAHHRDAAQRASDIAHDRTLRLLGYTVLRFEYFEITNEWPRIESEVRAAVAQGLHLAGSAR